MAYRNGEIPLALMVHLGGDHYLPPGTAARWRWAQRVAFEKYGIWLIITAGYNAYRPRWVQDRYWIDPGPPTAARPGTSSHGSSTRMAIDVYNWRALTWARFVAIMRLAGLTAGTVASEGWHVVDLNDPWSIPGFTTSTPTVKPIYNNPPAEEYDMRGIYNTDNPDEEQRRALVGEFTFQPISAWYSLSQWKLAAPVNVSQEEWDATKALVNARRASAGLPKIP